MSEKFRTDRFRSLDVLVTLSHLRRVSKTWTATRKGWYPLVDVPVRQDGIRAHSWTIKAGHRSVDVCGHMSQVAKGVRAAQKISGLGADSMTKD